ncbi:MAG: putative ammonia monooxygenase [Rhodospirillales bacterium]|nr:putative ammonia monooxygenase [Rhodospirillales bacterium]
MPSSFQQKVPEKLNEAAQELRANWRALALTVSLAFVGGFVFAHYKLPMPWVLGAMSVCTVASMCGVRIWQPRWLVVSMTMVLGLLFGTTIAPDIFSRVIEWLPSVIAVFVFVLATTAASMVYLMRVVKSDRTTAYFCSAPGGVIPMTAMGAHYGGDMRFIALVQSMRLIATVVVVPVSFALFGDYHPTGAAGTGGALKDLPLYDVPVLIALALGGWGLAKLCRLPAPELVGPMLVMAVAHATGTFSAPFPDPLVAFAQICVGARLGAGFYRLNLRTFGKQLAHATMVALLMLAMGVLFAFAVSPFTNEPMTALILAYAPGGIAEMSIIAFNLKIEVVFVITHQLIRFLFVVALVPAAVAAFKMKVKEEG